MSWNDIEANWKQMKGAVKARWGDLTDDDLREINGERERMVGKMMEIYNLSQDRAERELDEWLAVFRHSA